MKKIQFAYNKNPSKWMNLKKLWLKDVFIDYNITEGQFQQIGGYYYDPFKLIFASSSQNHFYLKLPPGVYYYHIVVIITSRSQTIFI